ncbi:MAG: cytidylyltransferase [Herbinix sp.]|nr:cytidylyltransferase [Herbinix sp.]
MKILCIVQARMGSERLPGKVMKEVLGIPMITYTLDRLKRSRYIDEIVLATSDRTTEESMVDYLMNHDCKVFRGSENNVLKRYIDAIHEFGGDIIIRVTGDCPLIDPVMLDHVVSCYLTSCYDYVGVDTLNYNYIRGLDVEVFSRESLERVYTIVKDAEEKSPYKEHVTYYMYQHPEEFKVFQLLASPFHRKDYRLCVDTIEDFTLINHIYEHFQDKQVPIAKVIDYLDEHPEIAAINRAIHQKIV